MKRFLNKNIQKLIKAGVISLFAFSCATKGNSDDPATTNVTVMPTIDQVKFDGYLAKVRNSGQYKIFATVNGAASTLPTTDTSIKSGFSYYKGLDRITALRVYLKNTSINSIESNSVAILGHTSSLASSANWAYNCGVVGIDNCNTPYTATANPNRPQSNASLGLFINPFFENDPTINRPMGFGFGSQTDFYMVESTTNPFPFQYAAIILAMRKATNNRYKMVVYDAYDSYRLPGTYAGNGFLDTTTILIATVAVPSTNTPSYTALTQFFNAAVEFNTFLKNNLSSVLVMPTGTMVKFTNANDGIIQAVNTTADHQVSSGYFNQGHANFFNAEFPISTEGFFTGNVVQFIEGKGGSASKNNIALALAVDGTGATEGAAGSDFKYKPYLEAVLPGSLRDYAFSVMIKPTFGNVAGNGTAASIPGTTHEVKSQIANSILASNINTLGSLMDSNVKAISLLKTNFTLKQYGNYNNETINSNALNLTNGSTLTEGFITLASPTIATTVGNNATLKSKIISYFDRYALLNNNTINDSLNGIYFGAIPYATTANEATKWSNIMKLYEGKEYMLSQFITTSDVVVCSNTCFADGSNIISMNGTHGKEGDFAIVEKKYQYYDVNGDLQIGVSTVYTYKGQVISSNVFGNGIVDFTTLYNTATASANSVHYRIFDTKANLSSVMGDGFRREGISNFLSKITTNVGSVYEGEGDTIEMSLNANISTKSKIEEKTQLAFANILKNSGINTGGNFNLGLIGFGFAVSGNETSSSKGLLTDEARKNKIMQGFVGGASRFGETFMAEANPLAFNIKNFEKNSEDESKISNFTAFVPVSENAGVSFLTSGSSVSSLMLAPISENNFSILSNSLGFRESYSNFAELFGEAKNIQGASLQFGDSVKFNVSFAVGERENLLNDTTEKSSFTSIEAEKSFTNAKVKVVSGVMKEDGSLLGSQFSGGLAIKSTTNYFAGIEAESKLVGSLYINGAFNYGFSKVDAGDSLLNNFKGVQTSAISLGLSDKNFLSGILGFTYSEGLRMNSGSVEAFNGKDSQRFDISSDGRERNFELSFGKTFKQTSSVKLALVHTENLNNIKGEKQNLIVLKAVKQF